MLRPLAAWRPGLLPRTFILTLIFGLGLPAGSHWAASTAWAASEAYTVRDLPVDAEAKSAAAAREVALAKGQREAYGLMLSRLVVAEDQARLPALGDPEIADLIEGFEIADERVSATRYRANLTVTFREDRIKPMLRALQLRFAESSGRSVVVIPVMIEDGGAVLWSDDNLWLQTWSARDVPGGLVPVVVPLGDLADIESLSAAQAISGDAVALRAFAERYGAGEAIVAKARVKPPSDAKGVATVALSVERFGGETNEIFDEQVRGGAGQSLDEVMKLATDLIAARLNERWKIANVIRYDTPGSLRAVVPLTGLRDWITLRDTLAGLSLVAEVEVVALARLGADIVLHYYGDQAQLEAALGARDFTLTPRPDGGFTLAPRPAPGTTVGTL